MWRLLRDLRAETPPRRRLMAEAVLRLAAARVALRVLPFPVLMRYFGRGPSGGGSGDVSPDLFFEIRRAVFRGGRYLPGRTVCFPRAIAAQAMLRRRGVASHIYYGAAREPDGSLSTHVWVRSGDNDVVGHRIAGRYSVLAVWPAEGKTRAARSAPLEVQAEHERTNAVPR